MAPLFGKPVIYLIEEVVFSRQNEDNVLSLSLSIIYFQATDFIVASSKGTPLTRCDLIYNLIYARHISVSIHIEYMCYIVEI